ncbi:hypothetical protein C7B67_00525 [filamentous cyanobacterium Phorm 6]|nr:hypothetical protein C7B67_00525 [filamentous cyanobacterium Phorm 6]
MEGRRKKNPPQGGKIRKKEEGRGKKEEGRRKKEEGRFFSISYYPSFPTIPQALMFTFAQS